MFCDVSKFDSLSGEFMCKIDDLGEAVDTISGEFRTINQQWQEDHPCNKVNLKKRCVNSITDGDDVWNAILKYSHFLKSCEKKLQKVLKQSISNIFDIYSRVKTEASIEDKIQRYKSKKEKGQIPINKCLNDIYGIRIVMKDQITKEQIEKIVVNLKQKIVVNLKLIDASKDEYKALHIYFRDGNFNFPWELQLWNKEDERSNKESHEKYKQGYLKWEND